MYILKFGFKYEISPHILDSHKVVDILSVGREPALELLFCNTSTVLSSTEWVYLYRFPDSSFTASSAGFTQPELSLYLWYIKLW